MKAYKRFKNVKGKLICRDFVYEVGKSYHMDEIEICKQGFHACLNPEDTLRYYSEEDTLAEVEISNYIFQKHQDTKVCAKDMTITRLLNDREKCQAQAKYISQFDNIMKHLDNTEWVDLGLPSGTLWCSHNYNVKSAVDWGEHYTWENALELDCNLPTKEQFQELYANTNSIWIKEGRLFTSKINDNSIFFPAAGFTNGTSFYYGSLHGDYWSSSFDTSDTNCAHCMFFYSSHVYPSDDCFRYRGFSVRPVLNK